MNLYDFTESYIIRVAIDQLKIENLFNKGNVENVNKTNSVNENHIIEDNSKEIYLTPKLKDLLPYEEEIIKMRKKGIGFGKIAKELNKSVKNYVNYGVNELESILLDLKNINENYLGNHK
jgi:DNA-binding NarL/FixJ family response regulator